MTLATLQLLQHDLIHLPKEVADTELGTFLYGVYREFQRAVASLDDTVGREISPKRGAISILCESILSAVEAAREAGLDSAVARISPGLDMVRDDLITVAQRNEATILRGQSLYRIRDANGTSLSSPFDVFHLPFELRRLAAAARYSTHGLPCLYLANSIYTCWVECRLPEISECEKERLETIYAARFEFARPPLLLDFCYPPWAVAEALSAVERPPLPELAGFHIMNAPIGPDVVARVEYLVAWLTIWPLLAAVSLRTPSAARGDVDRPEYVVPQMLMRWVQRSLTFDGIRYFSTRENPGNNTSDYAIDYAIPVKTSRLTGHCESLRRLFLCTKPIPFGPLAGADISKMLSAEHFVRAEKKFRRYMIVDDCGMRHYYGTTYCDMEYVLDLAPPYTLAACD